MICETTVTLTPIAHKTSKRFSVKLKHFSLCSLEILTTLNGQSHKKY